MQALHQERVHLHRYYARGALQQLFGQRSAAGADFDHQALPRRAHGRGDALEDRPPDEEMLSEFLRHSSAVSPAR